MTGIVIVSLLVLLIVTVVLLLKNVKGKMISKFDNLGLTTASGKYYLWADLNRIEYFMAVNRFSKEKKVHSLHFYFKEGKASIGYLMPGINSVLQKANELKVQKTEKIVGYHRK